MQDEEVNGEAPLDQQAEHVTGDAHSSLTPPIYVDVLTFNDDTRVELEAGHVVVLVGANNVGKSNALRDIKAILRSEGKSGHKVVTNIRFAEPDTHPEPLRDWVRRRFPRFRPNHTSPMMYGTGQGTVDEKQLEETPLSPQTISQIRKVVTFVANAQERLNLTKPSPPFDSRRSGPQTAIQALYNDTDKVDKLSNASVAAFGKPVTYSHHDGHWRLRLGEPDVEPEVTGRHLFPTAETKAAIDALDVVEEQGDGLRSYLGVLLELLAERHVFIVLDEPEAFLHPPQARQLAAAVLDVKQDEAQLFVATHDSHFVRGLLDAPEARLSIIRVSRDDAINPIRVIEPKTVKEIAGDPVLRHSNILDSIFHSAAVVCEAEADCLLYESVALDKKIVTAGTTIYFAGSSGKQRVRQTSARLRDLGVPTAAIVDFDIFKDEAEVTGLIEALGEDPAPLAKDLRRVCAQLRHHAHTVSVTTGTLRKKIDDVLSGLGPTTKVPAKELRRLSQLTSEMGEWSELKRHGVAATRGDLNRDVQSLLTDLSAKRLHVVPNGELESWFREAPGKGGQHVAHILDKAWHLDTARSEALIQFVSRVLSSLGA